MLCGHYSPLGWTWTARGGCSAKRAKSYRNPAHLDATTRPDWCGSSRRLVKWRWEWTCTGSQTERERWRPHVASCFSAPASCGAPKLGKRRERCFFSRGKPNYPIVSTRCIGLFWKFFRGEERMTFVGLTLLRIRSFRFVPLFALHTWRSLRQIRSARGFQTGAILADRSWTFWTMTPGPILNCSACDLHGAPGANASLHST
jgi:hypothetical protein